jgi:WD40 repeat protein
VEQYRAPRGEVLCCHTNGSLLAAGVGDQVLFWDRRAGGKPAGSFGDTHAGDVTQVRFHPGRANALVSASDDGLLAVFDAGAGLDEDEGFRAGLNIDTAPVRLGFYGPGGAKLWCCTSTETLHLWEWAAACDDDSPGGNGVLGEALAARQCLAAAAALSAGPAAAALGAGVDYLIGCEYNADADRLCLAAGTSEGTAGIFPVVEPRAGTPAGGLAFGTPVATLLGGHVEVVRSVLWPGAAGEMCLSGGEDARICLWSSAGRSSAPTASGGGGSSGSDGAVRRLAQAPVRRAAPY